MVKFTHLANKVMTGKLVKYKHTVLAISFHYLLELIKIQLGRDRC